MYRIFCLLIFILACGVHLNAQKSKGVQVKILHKTNVVLDTIIDKKGQEDIETIETIVSRYTDQPIYIDAAEVRELYVFSFENIKIADSQNKVEEFAINMDSIMNSIVERFDKAVNDSTMNAAMDSISASFKEMKKAIKAIDRSDLERAKNEVSEFIDKVKETRVIIVQDGDTIRIPKKGQN